MKNEVREILGYNVPVIGIVENLQEAISKAGSEQAVLNDYVSNVLAHSHYTILRRVIVSTLEKATGVKRKTRTEGSGEKAKVVIDETEGEYVARLETELGEETMRTFDKEVAAACEKVPVDYVAGTRGSATPAKKWLAAVDDLKAAGKFERFCSKYEIDPTQDEETVKIAVANKLKALVAEQERQAMAAATNV
jgi:hypothetical protein